MTPRVRAYELRALDWSELPPVTAGAHLAVPVRLADGSQVTRQYSLASHPQRRDMYEIAVLREEAGRGGSAAIHLPHGRSGPDSHWIIRSISSRSMMTIVTPC
jgi:ferredoxin-NADP reductase